MSYVFLSHNASNRELAERVQAALETLGLLTWVRDINIDWTQEENLAILGKAVQSSAALLVLIPRDNSEVADLSQDVHLGYQYAKPVLMLRSEEELPAILQRLTTLVPTRAEFSPLPQPIAEEEMVSGSILSRHGNWLVAALVLSILVASGVFFVFWSQRSTVVPEILPSPSATLLPASPTAPITQAALLPTDAPTLVPSATLPTTPTATSPATTTPSPTFTASALPTETPTIAPSATTIPPLVTLPPTATNIPPSATLPPTIAPTQPPTTAPSATTLPPSATLRPTIAPTQPSTTAPSATTLPPSATMTATVAPSSTPSPTLTETPSGCPIPAGWIAYSVVSGDTVFSIATRAGSDVATLRIGNCLADADVILVDQTLYIPPRTTATPSATATIPGTEGCSAPGVLITQPLAGTTLNGVVEVRGTANITDFASYRLEIRASGDPNYREIVRVTQPVSDNVLWQLDTDAFAPGNYLLRLTALTRRRGFPQPCTIPLIFQ